MKHLPFVLIIALISTASVWAADASQSPSTQGSPVTTKPFFDDFSGKTLDPENWLLARSQWGGKGANGGVIPDSIFLEPGKLIVKAHGDQYTGPVNGVQRRGAKITPIQNGRRVGGCLVTRDCYASGSYEVRMKVPQHLGVCTSMWTFHYLEVGKDHEEYIAHHGEGDTYVSNHEIDIELPGRPAAALTDIGYDWALFNTWVGERDQDYSFGPTKLPFEVKDGKFHIWRFDWHTGDPDGKTGKVIIPHVDFFLDDQLLHTSTEFIPVDAGNLWIGLWFPKNWAGVPDFDEETLEVNWVRITPFNEPGDRFKYSQTGPDPLLLGSKDWPERLQPKK